MSERLSVMRHSILPVFGPTKFFFPCSIFLCNSCNHVFLPRRDGFWWDVSHGSASSVHRGPFSRFWDELLIPSHFSSIENVKKVPVYDWSISFNASFRKASKFTHFLLYSCHSARNIGCVFMKFWRCSSDYGDHIGYANTPDTRFFDFKFLNLTPQLVFQRRTNPTCTLAWCIVLSSFPKKTPH